MLIFELRVDFGSKQEFSCHLCHVGEKAVEKEWCFKGQCMSPFTSPPFLCRGSMEAGECALVL